MLLSHLTASFVPGRLTQKSPRSEAVILGTSALAGPHTRHPPHKRTPLVDNINLLQMTTTVSIQSTNTSDDMVHSCCAHTLCQVTSMMLGTRCTIKGHSWRSFMYRPMGVTPTEASWGSFYGDSHFLGIAFKVDWPIPKCLTLFLCCTLLHIFTLVTPAKAVVTENSSSYVPLNKWWR